MPSSAMASTTCALVTAGGTVTVPAIAPALTRGACTMSKSPASMPSPPTSKGTDSASGSASANSSVKVTLPPSPTRGGSTTTL